MTKLRYQVLDYALTKPFASNWVLTHGSRWAVASRSRKERRGGTAVRERRRLAITELMSNGPIAQVPEQANVQHYELPSEFFALILGPRKKYSACLWEPGTERLTDAEDAMLDLTCSRASVTDGMSILDLGCGWGSLTFWIAQHYDSHVTAVSNSSRQRQWIEAERDRLGLTDQIDVVTADINTFDPGRRFDRVISVEMFEHLTNWRALLGRIETWLNDDGKLFVHIFSHSDLAYRFEGTWAAERFFAAGTMPSHDLLSSFDDDLIVQSSWRMDGTHYAKTLDAWLQRLESRCPEAIEALSIDRTISDATRLVATWRLFLIATREMWNWREGSEWLVSHYVLAKSNRNEEWIPSEP